MAIMQQDTFRPGTLKQSSTSATNMPQFLKRLWPLLVVLVAFVIAKLPHLDVAYYWDESWPYAAAVKEMYRHGASMLPGALDPDLSKGHPLFFHALAASWMRIFGASHVAVHSFALTLSVLLLIAIYEAGLYLFSFRTAVLALLLFAVQEMFFVQSSMILPEVLVALLCFVSIVSYAGEKYLAATIFLTMLFFTKESGVVAGFVIGIDALVRFFGKEPIKKRLSRILTVAIPCVLIGTYFVLQKQLRGWYFFPEHTQMMHLDWKTIWYDFRMHVVQSEFYNYYRFYYYLPVLLFAIIAAIRQKNLRYLAILLPATCIYYFVDDLRAGRLLPSVPFFIVFIASVFYFLYEYSKLFTGTTQRKLILLLGAFTLVYLIFSGINFFTPRYLQASLVSVFFIIAASTDALFNLTWRWLFYPYIAIIICIGVMAFRDNDHIGDNDHLGMNGLAVQQGVVDYFEQNVPYTEWISMGSFLEGIHLSDPRSGFLRSNRAYKVQWFINDSTDYIVFDNIEPDVRYGEMKTQHPDFELIKRIEKGKVWGEIYKRKIQ